MQEECPEAVGSMTASDAKRRKLAKESHQFNLKDPSYQTVFPDSIEEEKSAGRRNEAEEKKDEEEDDSRWCRYCRTPGGELVSPCDCKGGNKWVHLECLGKWQYQAILSQSTHPKVSKTFDDIFVTCWKR